MAIAFSQIFTSVNKLKLLPALKKILFGQALIITPEKFIRILDYHY